MSGHAKRRLAAIAEAADLVPYGRGPTERRFLASGGIVATASAVPTGMLLSIDDSNSSPRPSRTVFDAPSATAALPEDGDALRSFVVSLLDAERARTTVPDAAEKHVLAVLAILAGIATSDGDGRTTPAVVVHAPTVAQTAHVHLTTPSEATRRRFRIAAAPIAALLRRSGVRIAPMPASAVGPASRAYVVLSPRRMAAATTVRGPVEAMRAVRDLRAAADRRVPPAAIEAALEALA